jgi:hypothetical protein
MHPTISYDEARRLSAELLEGGDVDVTAAVKWVGSGDEVPVEPWKALAVELDLRLDRFASGDTRDKDAVEGAAAVLLHAVAADLPLQVLDDPGFWRYVSLVHLWRFITWRESAFAADEPDWHRYGVYIDGKRFSECVPLRMHLRARVGTRDDDYSLVSEIPAATDLWRSHIMRVRTSYSPVLAQALLQSYKDDRMSIDDVRALAKRIQRVASNVVLHLYEPDEAASVIAELRGG